MSASAGTRFPVSNLLIVAWDIPARRAASIPDRSALRRSCRRVNDNRSARGAGLLNQVSAL